MNDPARRRAVLRCALLAALLLLLSWPSGVLADAELDAAVPADGSTVPGPFDGPIVLTFSAELADGSRADLVDAAGDTLASAAVDGSRATMTITPDEPLAEGIYEVRWVSIATDGHLTRDTLTFTVSAPPTPEPTPEPTFEPSESAAATPSPLIAPAPDPGAMTSGSDVLLPILVVFVVAGAGAAYFVSRRRGTLS